MEIREIERIIDEHKVHLAVVLSDTSDLEGYFVVRTSFSYMRTELFGKE